MVTLHRIFSRHGNMQTDKNTTNPAMKLTNQIKKCWKKFSPENILSTVATADTAITALFDQVSHQAGTNEVNQIRLEMKLISPRTIPQHVSDLQTQRTPANNINGINNTNKTVQLR